jgi:leucyl/phenylalanyl-tRNA--protein transferase
MPVTRKRVGWWSPDPRGILPLEPGGLRVTRSLRASCRRFTVTRDAAFDAVIEGCADVRRSGGWISSAIRTAYTTLHELGWVHSVEAWSADGGLAGGLYGVAIGRFFAGESMFTRQRDASKVALVALVDHLRDKGFSLLDVQWQTPHLATLGVVEISRAQYLARLCDAVSGGAPVGSAWRRASSTKADCDDG